MEGVVKELAPYSAGAAVPAALGMVSLAMLVIVQPAPVLLT